MFLYSIFVLRSLDVSILGGLCSPPNICLPSASFHHFLFPVLTLPRLFFSLSPEGGQTQRSSWPNKEKQRFIFLFECFVFCSLQLQLLVIVINFFLTLLLPFHFIFQPLPLQLYFILPFQWIFFLTILISNFTLPVLQAVFAIFISVFNSFYVPLCLSQVVTPPLPLPAVPLRCPTAMIPWKGATIQVCFNHKHIVHLINRHTDRYIIVQSFCSGACSLPCVLLKLLHLLRQKIQLFVNFTKVTY